MTPTPPPLARWLISRLTPPSDREVVLGDLDEGFGTRSARHGHQVARRWYWDHTVRSITPSLARRWRPTATDSLQRGPHMDGLWQDIRFNVRSAMRRPLVTAVAIASLTIGIAMTTVVFSLMDATLLRPLAVTAPAELSLITEQRATSVNYTLPHPDYLDWNRNQQVFTSLLASSNAQVSIRFQHETAVVTGEAVSGTYFETLGVTTRRGRLLTQGDDSASAAPAVVVSRRLWERLAGADTPFSPTAATINNTSFTVVGIAPESFAGIHVGQRADFWVTLAAMGTIDPARTGRILTERRASWLWLMGRRKPGVTHEAAAADLNRVEAGLAPTVGRQAPKQLRVTDGRRGTDTIPEATTDTLRVLLGAAALVLLIACANVANLLLARSADRRRELQVRAALGASRWRLARLLATDAALTAIAAGTLGLAIAWPGAKLAASMMAVFGRPLDLAVQLDWRTAGFAVALGALAAVLASLAPALHVLQTFRHSAGDSGSRSMTAGRAATRLRQGLLVGQFALAVTLVVAAGLLLRTVDNLRSLPAGFDTDRLALVTVDVSVTPMDAAQSQAYVADATRQLAAVPGVESVGFARVVPVGFGGSRRTVEIPGYEPAPDEDMELNNNLVTGDYFQAMGIPVIAGRALTASDAALPVAVVNETMARRYWPDGQAVGRTLSMGEGPVTIVGVVRDVKYRMLREEPRPSFYLPFAGAVRGGVFHVRTTPSPADLLPALRRAVTAANPQVPVTDLRTLRMQADANINDDRVAMLIGLSLAVAALVLAAVGLFGSMSYLVTQRTREIGVRLALGADGRRIHSLVLRQGLQLALAGTGTGLLLSVWATRSVESRLFGVSAFDPYSFAAAALVLGTVALAATLAPARRAARVDPIHALRDE